MMQKDKEKTGTVSKLVVRVGGLVIGLPVAIGLGGMLMLTIYTLLGILGAGIASELTSILAAIVALCVAMLFILVRATLKYSGGIQALFQRLRGIQAEQARIERVMQKDEVQDTDDILLHAQGDDIAHQKFNR
jgi:hypothetical protein